MHQALYRKWRPQTFDEVCGQEHITSVLKYETANNRFSHAYLFCGSRGTGKTSCAKILAKAVNCENPQNGNPCNKCSSCMAINAGTATDVLEMDAASNNGVENIRDIRDEVVYTPSALKYRVYIVDEVHMLSGSAFNALLKTLEEPPEHVVFILATTELHKLPSTIVSRCQRFDFRRITTAVLSDRLAYISEQENIEYESEALRLISKFAQGGMRDAISLLELCAGTRSKITAELVDNTIGSGGRENIERTVKAIAKSDYDTLFSSIDSVVRSSRDISVFWQELVSYYRDMLVFKTASGAERYLDLTENETERLKNITSLFTKETLIHHCRILDDTLRILLYSGTISKRTTAEMALVKMCDMSLDTSADALLSRISKLENLIASGRITASQMPSTDTDYSEDKHKKVNEEADNVFPKITVKEADIKDASQSGTNEGPVLKPLRGWNEIAHRAAVGDVSKVGFLKGAKAYLGSNGLIYVKFSNDFAMSMVNIPQIRDNIRAAINIDMQISIDDSELIFDLISGKENISDLDEFENLDL
ncbi:MAG: DNA polymerase III subunit gamma/tau [Ruminococcaceae bacterium]|nr:DNA polymerase III subunit gamma/tau [Oscillospiraceae bacterium]